MLMRDDGVRTWRTVELALSKTYFLATVQQRLPEGEFAQREIMFTYLRDVIDQFTEKTELFSLKRLDLMSPGYVNGQDRLSLDPIAEIWGTADHSSVSYVLQDGRRLEERRNQEKCCADELSLLLKIDSGRNHDQAAHHEGRA